MIAIQQGVSKMKTRAIVFMLALLIPALAFGQIGPYTQDFEGLTSAPEVLPATSLGADGWLLFVNVFDSGGGYLGGYGTFDAPNTGTYVSAVVEGQGGPDQELKQLSVFSDYNNQGDHTAGNILETNVFQERTIDAANVGQMWTMTFDAKMGNLGGASTAKAFIKTLDSSNNLTNFITAEMTDIPDTWANYNVSLTIVDGLVGQKFQFGFLNTASNNEPSGVFYDNINLSLDGAVATEEASFGSVKSLFR
jgi:hypothetical protein